MKYLKVVVSEILNQNGSHRAYFASLLETGMGSFSYTKPICRNVREIAQDFLAEIIFRGYNLSKAEFKVYSSEGDHPSRTSCDSDLPGCGDKQSGELHRYYTAHPNAIVVKGIEILLQDPEVIASAQEKAKQKAA